MICFTKAYYEQAFPDSIPPCDTCKRKDDCCELKPKKRDEIDEQKTKDIS